MSSLDVLTDYRVDDQDNNMSIRTETLDPIVSSSYRYQFRLDTSAFLDKNTLLTFKANATGALGNNDGRLNCWNGGLGCIKAVEFQVGDFQVQRIEDINLWASTNVLYALPPQVQTKKLGHYLHNQLRYEINSSSGATLGGTSDQRGQIIVDNELSGIDYGRSNDANACAINSFKLSTDSSNNQKVGIPLGMLLPMLNQEQLPLFLMTNYKVHITIEFESDASKFCNDISKTNFGAGESLAASDGEIAFSDVQLLVDYLILPARVQNSYLERTQSEGGFNLDFVNPLNIKKSEVAHSTANTEYSLEHRINVINQEVHYVQQLKRFGDTAGGNAKKFYNKVLLGQRADGFSLEQIQYNVNGVDIYTHGFVSNPCELYNNCTYVLGRDLQVVKPLYMKDPNTEASMLSPPQNGLLGKYKPLMLDLSNGEPSVRGGGRFIGEYPIIVRMKQKPQDATDTNSGATAYFTTTNFEIAPTELEAVDYTYFVGATRVLNVKTMPNGAQNVVVSDM